MGETCEFCVIGGGIVGLAVARALLARQPGAGLVVLEKEGRIAAHQTGRNSGVIHSGVYYTPGSLKARLCKAGAEATKAYCAACDVPFEVCGKLFVATDAAEEGRMDALHARARENGVAVERLDAGALVEREPHVARRAALLVPATGIVDYPAMCDALATDIRAAGGEIRTGAAVAAIEEDGDGVSLALLQNPRLRRDVPFPRGLQATRTISAVPRAEKRFMRATRMWVSAVWRSGSRAAMRSPKDLRQRILASIRLRA